MPGQTVSPQLHVHAALEEQAVGGKKEGRRMKLPTGCCSHQQTSNVSEEKKKDFTFSSSTVGGCVRVIFLTHAAPSGLIVFG